MFNFFFAFVLIIVASIPLSPAQAKALSPFGLSSEKIYKLPPEIPKFKYWYGSLEYGTVFYTGTEDIDGFETELHLEFRKRKITNVILILGPFGLDNYNCFNKYKKINSAVVSKYGSYKFVKERKDVLIDDLLIMSPCQPVRAGLHEIYTFWIFKDYKIISTLFGDDEGIYIEIDFIYNLKKTQKNIFKKLL